MWDFPRKKFGLENMCFLRNVMLPTPTYVQGFQRKFSPALQAFYKKCVSQNYTWMSADVYLQQIIHDCNKVSKIIIDLKIKALIKTKKLSFSNAFYKFFNWVETWKFPVKIWAVELLPFKNEMRIILPPEALFANNLQVNISITMPRWLYSVFSVAFKE